LRDIVAKIKVMIADDHPGFREGLGRIFADEEDLEVVAKTGDGEEAVKLATELKPDVALIDIAMPGIDGIEAAKRIREVCPDTQILMLSAYDYQSYIVASLQIGAAGYILKNTSIDHLVSAIRLVHTGEAVYDLKTISKVFTGLRSDDRRKTEKLTKLNRRELDVLKLVAKGLANKRIADELDISDRTVQTHMVNIFDKLKVKTRTQAAIRAIEEGWLNQVDIS
jgi:DNA-binding NarL/FixJ family response regulator